MESLTDLRAGVEHDLQALAQPLRDRLANVDEMLQERLDEVQTLKDLRRQILTALRPFLGENELPLEPGRNSKPGPKRRPAGKSAALQVSESRVADALAYLRESRNGTSFTRRDIENFNGLSDATASAIIRALLDREQIRLHHIDRKHGNIREYRLVG